jgi:drug/metabolite transporter (DMT)-like permease
MRSPWVLGIIAGCAASALSIASDLRRGDPHLVSAAPGLLGVIAIAALIYTIVRRSDSRGSGREAGMQATLGASGVCALALAAFTWFYLPNHPLTLAGFAAVGSVVMVYIVGYAATLLGVRSNMRLHRTASRSSPR